MRSETRGQKGGGPSSKRLPVVAAARGAPESAADLTEQAQLLGRESGALGGEAHRIVRVAEPDGGRRPPDGSGGLAGGGDCDRDLQRPHVWVLVEGGALAP